MSIDTTESGDIIANDSAGDTTTSEQASPAPADTSTTAASAPVEAADSTGPASAETQANADGSLTPANTTLQAANKQPVQATPAQPAVNWEQRYSDLRKRETALSQQVQQYQQRYQGIDPNSVRQWQEAQQRAQQERLPAWNRNNPQNPRFRDTLRRFDDYRNAMGRAQTPEQKEVLRQTIGQSFSQDDVQTIQAWENHQREFQANFAADPAGTIADIVAQTVRQEIAQSQKMAEAEQTVGKWFNDPANKAIVDRYGPQMMELMQRGNDWRFVSQYFTQKAQVDGLQSRVGEADKAVTAANERDRLLKGAAAVTRDPKPQTVVDPVKIAKQRGIAPGSEAYYDLLLELKGNGLSA